MANTRPNVPAPQVRYPLERSSDVLSSLHCEVDRLFDDFARGWPSLGRTFLSRETATALRPTMDITETDKEIEITAELPGLLEKDVQLDVSGNILTIRGEKKAEKEEKDRDHHLFERSYGSFSRSVELPSGIDPNQIKASLANGILTVAVPKPASVQSKKIEIKPAA